MTRRRPRTSPRLAPAAALVLAGAGAAAAQTPSAAMTVEEAVALALANNRGVEIAVRGLEQAEQRVAAARTRRLPSLEVQAMAGTTLHPIRVSFPAGSFGSFPSTGPIPGEDTVVEAPRSLSGNVNATLAQPISQLHRIGLGTRLSELGRDAEREKVREQRAAVAAEVRRLYYGLLQTESVLRATEELVQVYRELDRVVGQQVLVEVALRSDGLQAKSRLAAEEYELARLRNDLATGKERLNSLLGRDLGRQLELVAVPDSSVEELDLELATSGAIERRPDLAQARLSVEQAETDRRLKKAEALPELSLAVSYYSFVNVDLLPRNVAQVGVQLKWQPFDWGRRGKEQAEKALQVDQARSALRQAEDRVRIEVAQGFRKLQEARLLIEAERVGRQAAVETLRVVASRHRHDAALLKDVLEAQAAATAAQARYDGALLTFWTARADFRKAVGEEL